MSNFTVLVIGPKGPKELDEVLAPYDEKVKFPPYIKFTCKDKAAEKKRLLKYYRHQLTLAIHDINLQNKFIALDISDEDYFFQHTMYYNDHELNTQGEPISTYNPNTRWSSWKYIKKLYFKNVPLYMIGMQKKHVDWNEMSRFSTDQAMVDWIRMQSNPSMSNYVKGMMYDYWMGETKSQYMGRKELFMTSAYILRGKWFERDKIGWWSQTIDCMDREKWINQYIKMLQQIKPDTQLTTIECHI